MLHGLTLSQLSAERPQTGFRLTMSKTGSVTGATWLDSLEAVPIPHSHHIDLDISYALHLDLKQRLFTPQTVDSEQRIGRR